ncbi:MAG: phosphatase PAP2 family protein [Ignavibacteriae bacterium]|nr:phosphatase PAP2 family protein [Ignavibacteriota bacterium]
MIALLNSSVDYWHLIIFSNFILFSFILFISKKDGETKSIFWKNLHFWYVIPLVFFTFKEINLIIRAIHSVDYDSLLISIDRFIFGLDPTVFLFQFANPILTEILQIAYASFFFLPIILGLEMQLKGKTDNLKFIIFIIIYGFLLSYIGYLFLPAVGPRFTLHNFEMTNIELPGLFLTNFLREVVNSGESIPSGTLNPMVVVQRDVFPSGHTQMTLIVMYLTIRLKSSYKIGILFTGTLLIFATVYMRYHYFVDLIGGTIFMIFTVLTAKHLYNWWQKKTNNTLFDYK